ncbi:MAG: 1-deoxy-D-xylulose-5-phosphate reductoisomerase, partial [Clostridia bacterium]|nr:1-deoxy-D-xylulose-5-phosphate reductoisomerase [Clostridia bacterium]
LMNKGFEVIEAVHLFGVAPEKVEVIVHRESMIHSMVEYIDHSIIAQMSVPDMRHCVQYALTHPRRLPAEGTLKQADLFALGKLTFGRPDTEVFPLLALARDCIAKGGALPCVLNAANEIVVAAFLAEKIPFCQISELVSRAVAELSYTSAWHTYSELMAADTLAREIANRLVNA